MVRPREAEMAAKNFTAQAIAAGLTVEQVLTEARRINGSARIGSRAWMGATDAELVTGNAAAARLIEDTIADLAKRAQIAADAPDAAPATWTRHNGEWVATGQHLTEGQRVAVSRRDGSVQLMTVSRIIRTDADGATLAAVRY